MKYTVKGIAFCPVTVTTEVEAPDEQTALEQAKRQAKDWRARPQFCAMDAAEGEWFDWSPTIDDVTANTLADTGPHQ